MISRKRSLTFEVMIDRRKQVVSSMYYVFQIWQTVIGRSDICARVLYRLPKQHQKMMELDTGI